MRYRTTSAAPQGLEPAVVEVESRASEGSWTVEVRRIPAFAYEGELPHAADVPADIRAGLRAWLDAAEEASA
jgi:hypothetical protein